MDGFSLNQDILVIAATNRKDILDSALLRPGRFDRILYIGLPDKSSRKSILDVYLKNKLVDYEVNIDLLAEITAGFSGAQIKNFINEAAIYAARVGSCVITQENLENAIEKLVVGIVKKKESRSDDVLQRVAIHEMGHGLLAYLFNDYFQLQKITIQSTYNGAGGFTLFNEYPEIIEGGLYTKDLLMKRLIIALGGKAAESVFYDDKFMSVGAMQDLKQANNIAQKMIGNFGMGNELKVFYNENIDTDSNPFLGRSLGQADKYSEKTKRIFDYEVNELVQDAYHSAIKIININKNTIIDLVEVLRKNISLSGEDVNNFLLENKITIYPLSA
jgi:cell division protease FtsH